jgi:hypothetical protein
MVQKSINLAAALDPLFNDNTDEIIKKWPCAREQSRSSPTFLIIQNLAGRALKTRARVPHLLSTCSRRQKKFRCRLLIAFVQNADVEQLKGAWALKYYFRGFVKGAVSKVSATSIRVTLEVYMEYIKEPHQVELGALSTGESQF